MTKADKKAAVIRAALELIAERGFHGAPAANIAARARVGVGTIYRYFENKDALIVGIMHDLEARVAARLFDEAYLKDGTARERFLHISGGLLNYYMDNPLDFRFVEQFMNSPYGAAFCRDKIFGEPSTEGVAGALRRLFEDGMDGGLVKPLPLPVLFSLSFGPVMFIMRDHILGLITLDEPLMDATVKACWDAIKA
ncbi:MAG: TetR/AcrR family transcriptional regulator [Nitrospirae bacterium]|nr:TetR/AcrR family transcriptional regulator [Nitrospirota bacterium]